MRVAILGAGPAGMSCANACQSFGLEPVVIDRAAQAGGTQLSNFHPNLWLLGYPDETGQEMTRRMVRHFLALDLALRLDTELAECRRQGAGFALTLTRDGERVDLAADALVLATGMRPRSTPELAAMARQTDRLIIGPLNDALRDQVRDGRVLVLGGGDNALDHALMMAERHNQVRVCARRGFIARKPFLDSCTAQPAIELRDHCVPDRLEADAQGIRAHWGKVSVRYDWVLVMFGYAPNTECLAAFDPALRPALTDDGHVRVDGWQRTSVVGLYAAGDLTPTPQPSVAGAIAQGLAAARAIERDHFVPGGIAGRTVLGEPGA